MGEGLGPSPEEMGVKETPEEKSERISRYNEASLKTGKKTPFDEPDIIPDATLMDKELSDETKEHLRKKQEESDFGNGPVPKK